MSSQLNMKGLIHLGPYSRKINFFD